MKEWAFFKHQIHRYAQYYRHRLHNRWVAWKTFQPPFQLGMGEHIRSDESVWNWQIRNGY